MARFAASTEELDASEVYDSGPLTMGSSDSITGGVYSDQDGTIYIEQSIDGGVHWDISTSYSVSGGDGTGIDERILTPVCRVRFENGASPQTEFRITVRASTAGAR